MPDQTMMEPSEWAAWAQARIDRLARDNAQLTEEVERLRELLSRAGAYVRADEEWCDPGSSQAKLIAEIDAALKQKEQTHA